MMDLSPRDPSQKSYLDKRTLFERPGVASSNSISSICSHESQDFRKQLKQRQLQRRKLEQQLSARRLRGEDVSTRERILVATGTAEWITSTTSASSEVTRSTSEQTITTTTKGNRRDVERLNDTVAYLHKQLQAQSTGSSGGSQKEVERLNDTVACLRKQLQAQSAGSSGGSQKEVERLNATVSYLQKACARLEDQIQGHAEFLEALRAEHAEQIQGHEEFLGALKSEHVDELADLKRQLREQHADQIEGHEEFLGALKSEHADELADLKRQLRERERGSRQEVRWTPSFSEDAEKKEKSVEFSAEAEKIAKVHEKLQQAEQSSRQLERVEGERERQLNDAELFIKHLAECSGDMALAKTYDMQSLELIAMGSYGFVATCCPKQSASPSAVKLQSSRWAGHAMREWAHATACSHPNIVCCSGVTLHHDVDRRIRERITGAFADGMLNGKEPQMLPSRYFCLTMEHMDAGSTQSLADRGLVTPRATGAIVRQVAAALAYMHKLRRTHNNVKPANILLCTSPGCNDLVPKLADFGLAEHSVNREKDSTMLAHSLFCLGLNRSFERRPDGSDIRVALKEFMRAGQGNLWCALGDVVDGLCKGSLEVAQVVSVEELQGLTVRLPQA